MMETMCETYETGDDIDEDFYENDLQLAAELGKALLERNRELEAQLQQQQQLYQEQSMELQHVSKQLETLRTMTESRNRVYEEVDRISQDLERQNQKLTMDAKADRQKIDRLTAAVEHLEHKVEDQQKKLEEAKKAADKTKGGKKNQEKRRTASLASLDRNHDSKGGYYMGDLAWTQTTQFKKLPLNPWEAELLKLQEALQHIKTQWTIERRKKEDLEVDLDVLEQENKSLETKVRILEERLSEAMLLEYELEQARQQSPEGVCRQCRGVLDMHEELHAGETELLKEVEHDAPLLLSEAKAVKLEGGGSLYGSSESINKVSADAREIEESKSILDELETQYKSLFQKYESLIQNKTKRLSQTMQTDDENAEDRALRRRLAHKEVQTLLHMTLNRDYFQESCQPPPYKALFKDLFATLRKTRIDENPEQDKLATTPGETPVTSPSMEFSRVTEGLSALSKGLTSPMASSTPAFPPKANKGEESKDKTTTTTTTTTTTSTGSGSSKGCVVSAKLMKEEVYES
ncbi:cerebellar degeneration-related protein 2-like isoform X2 [Babylonia areolata]|uniref:cerebellar degeneration-related protein 2-like isoform X2 n=1 Tax=Babylonia areolata TaxID=304850 RepID=UPI003FD57909